MAGLTAVSPMMALAFTLGAGYIAISMISARTALGLWFVAICFVPGWLGLYTGVYFWEAPALICLVTIPAVVVHARPPVLTWGDVIPLGLIVVCVGVSLVGTTPFGQSLTLIAQGALPYLVARHLAPVAGLDWVYRALSGVLAVIAVFAIFEYAADWHPFTGLFANSPIGFWSEIQLRGGVVRSEATFGHAIALGASLAAAIPLALGSTFSPRTKALLLGLFGLGILTTASRSPLLAALLGILLTVVLIPRDSRSRGRTVLLLVTGVVGIIVATTLAGRFAETEAVASATYRSDLYDALLPSINPYGLADSFLITANGAQTMQGFTSIDSAFLQIGLLFGLIPLLIACGGLLLVVLRLFTRRSNPPAIALVAQIPLFATVWLIAQYMPIVWFLVGLVVAASLRPRAGTPGQASVQRRQSATARS